MIKYALFIVLLSKYILNNLSLLVTAEDYFVKNTN